MSDEKLDKDLAEEVDKKAADAPEAEPTTVLDPAEVPAAAEEPEATTVIEPSRDKPADAGETRVSPATAAGEDEGDQKGAAAKRNRVVGAVVCCLVALVALIGGVGYVSGAFGGAEQAAQTTAAEQETSAFEESSKSQEGADSKSVEEPSADVTGDAAAADQSAEQPAEQGQAESGDTNSQTVSHETSGGAESQETTVEETSSNSGESSAAPALTPEPEPTPAPAPAPQPATITVYVSIDSSRANHYDSSWPTSMGSRSVTLSEGSSVYDALCAMGVSVGGSSKYVSSINGLSEMACGSMSGWTYSVDGVFANKACGKYILSGGETVCWVYTTNDEPTMPM